MLNGEDDYTQIHTWRCRSNAAVDKQQQRVSKWWMGGVAAIMSLYVVLLGYKPSSPEWLLEGDEDDLDM